MRRKFYKKIHIFFKILISIFLVCSFFVSLLFFDATRQGILNCVSYYLKKSNVVLQVSKANSSFSKIDEIFFQSPEGFKLDLQNVSLSRDGMFSRFKIYVDKLQCTFPKSEGSSEDSMRQASSIAKNLRAFVQELNINSGIVFADNKNYKFEEMKYASNSSKDSLSFKIEHDQFLNIELKWSGIFCRECLISFSKFFETDGFIKLYGLRNKLSNFELQLQRNDIKAKGKGSFENFIDKIILEDALLTYGDKNFKIFGELYPNELRSEIISNCELNSLLKKVEIPDELRSNFQNIQAKIKINGQWNRLNKFCDAKIDFEKNNKKVGDVAVSYTPNFLKIEFENSFLNLYGHNLKKSNVFLKNSSDFSAELIGDDFKSVATGNLGDVIKFNSFNLTCDQGICESVGDIRIANNKITGKLNLNFKELSFFEKIIPLRGSVKCSVDLVDNFAKIDAKIPKLFYDEMQFYNGDICGSLGNFEVGFKNIKVADSIALTKFQFKRNDKKISVNSKLNGKSKLSLSGEVDGDKLSLSGKLSNKLAQLDLKKCDLNFGKREYEVNVNLSNADKLKTGEFFASLKPQAIKIDLKQFPLHQLMCLVDKVVPNCLINGLINLKAENRIFVGQGTIETDGLISSKNLLNANIKCQKKGISIDCQLKNRKDILTVDAFWPVLIRSNFNIDGGTSKNVDATIKGRANLENIFNLSDGTDLRGAIISNLKISGTTSNPKIDGNIKCDNMQIVVGDLALKNGKIELIGNQNKLVVKHAQFIDNFKNTAIATGDGKFILQNGIPNLDVNLNLKFDDFRLLDADKFKLNISGSGKMFGLLQNLKIAGDVSVPYCKIDYDSEEDFSKYKDLNIENDVRWNTKTEEQDSFFDYDIKLKMPKIQVNGNIYNLEFAGDLTLLTYLNKATLEGFLNLKNGKINLFNQRMVFTKGTINFMKQFPFSPEVDLSCKKSLQSLEVFLDVHSSSDDGVSSINLHSKPNLSPDVILSRMMFGKNTKDLSVGEAAQLAHALTSLSKKEYIFSVLNTFQKIGIIDSLSFTTENKSTKLYKDSTNDNDVNVRAGKYVNDNVFISVNKKAEETSFDVDFSLSDNVSLKANTNGEVGINWKYRY